MYVIKNIYNICIYIYIYYTQYNLVAGHCKPHQTSPIGGLTLQIDYLLKMVLIPEARPSMSSQDPAAALPSKTASHGYPTERPQ